MIRLLANVQDYCTRKIEQALARAFGPHMVYPDAAAESVQGCLDNLPPQAAQEVDPCAFDAPSAYCAPSNDVDDLLRTSTAVEILTDVLAATLGEQHPRLDYNLLHHAIAKELWYTTQELTQLARMGAIA